MTIINPPPIKIPESLRLDEETKLFFDELLRTIYQLWYFASVLGGTIRVYKTVTSAYTIQPLDDVIDCTSGTFTVTLPPAAPVLGEYYDVKNSGAGIITLEADGSETIDGQLNQTLNTKDNLQVLSDGTGWIVI